MDVENHDQILNMDKVGTIRQSPDDKYLLVVMRDWGIGKSTRLRVVNLSEGREMWAYESEQGIRYEEWSDDGTYLAICTEDNIIYIFDSTTGREIWAYRNNFPASLSWSPDAHYLALAGSEEANTTCILSISRKEVVESFIGTFRNWSPDGKFVEIFNSDTTTLHIFDCLIGERFDLKGFPGFVGEAGWSPNSRYLVLNTADPDPTLQVLDFLKNSIVWRGMTAKSEWSPDSTYLAAFIEGKLYVIDPTTGKETKVSEKKYFVDEDTYIGWSPSGKYIEAGSSPEYQIFDPFERKQLLSLPYREYAWSRRGDKIAVANDNEIIIYPLPLQFFDFRQLK